MWGLEPTPSDRSIEMADLSPLRRRMIEDMTVRNLSPATQRSYISAVSQLGRYFGRAPDRLELEDVRGLPGASGLDRHLMAGTEPDRLCTTVFLRRHARRGAHPGAYSLCAAAPRSY